MKNDKKSFLVVLSPVLLITLLIVSLILFFTSNSGYSDSLACFIGIMIYVLGIIRLKDKGYEVFGCIGVILLYFFLTEYGLCIINSIFGTDKLPFSTSILKYLTSDSYVPAIYLTNVAFATMILAATIKKKDDTKLSKKLFSNVEIRKQKVIYVIGIIFLFFSLT